MDSSHLKHHLFVVQCLTNTMYILNFVLRVLKRTSVRIVLKPRHITCSVQYTLSNRNEMKATINRLVDHMSFCADPTVHMTVLLHAE